MKLFDVKDKFVGEILKIWVEIHFQRNLESFEDFVEQDLWNNSLIRNENRTVNFEDWRKSKVTKVKHLLRNGTHSTFLSHSQHWQI